MSPITDLPTLEARWLEFVRRTQDVFAAYPYMIPIRQPLFKTLIDRQSTFGAKDQAKQWLKLVLRRNGSTYQNGIRADVVFWLSSGREVLVEAVLPVMKAVQAAGINTALVTSKAVYDQIDPALNPILFQTPYHRHSGARWKTGWEALRAVLPDDLQQDSYPAFANMGNDTDNSVLEAKRLLTRLNPCLLVLPVDQLLPDSAVCVAAEELNIDSLVLLHGAVSAYNAPITAQHMAVWGELSRDQMVRLGVPAEKLVILGSPRHDNFPTPLPPDVRSRFQQTLGLRDLPTFVFFSNGNDVKFTSRETVEGCAAWLNAAAEQLSDRIQFAVRLHPNEDGALYVNYPCLRVFKKECDLATTIASADVCGALCSTVMVDTLLYHKPVLQFYADGWPDLAENWQRGLARRIANPQQLVDFLTAGLEDKIVWETLADEQAGLTETVFANHGKAYQTVALHVIEHIQSSSVSPDSAMKETVGGVGR